MRTAEGPGTFSRQLTSLAPESKPGNSLRSRGVSHGSEEFSALPPRWLWSRGPNPAAEQWEVSDLKDGRAYSPLHFILLISDASHPSLIHHVRVKSMLVLPEGHAPCLSAGRWGNRKTNLRSRSVAHEQIFPLRARRRAWRNCLKRRGA